MYIKRRVVLLEWLGYEGSWAASATIVNQLH